MKELDLMVTITDRDRAEDFSELYGSEGIPLVLTALGHGTATREVLDYFGLSESEKAVMFTVASRQKAFDVLRRVKRELYIDIPGNGIVVVVPISSVGGAETLRVLTHQHKEEIGGREQKMKSDYELIIAITNDGCNDLVMQAAREGHATGGTVIHARGTGDEHVRRFFGLSIADERELVFIVASSKNKAAIMKSIMEHAGKDSDAESLVISLPVTSVVGLREPGAEDEE